MDQPRSSGLLLHISSLPGDFGMGDFGPEAYRFADFLAASRQELWQVLPLVPTGLGNSPYASPSTFASNPLFISIDDLIGLDLITADEAEPLRAFPTDHIDFQRVEPARLSLLCRAFERFESGQGRIDRNRLDGYINSNQDWLLDYAEFMALKEHFAGRPWMEWPKELAQRREDALQAFRRDHGSDIRRHMFWQFLFHEQWHRLKSYCNERGIRIFGDLPIYVALDSADVWANPELFYLDDDGRPTVVAGVPPDYFSETGQRWGNPLYRWDVMRTSDYEWWYRRFARLLDRVDLLRLDHFRAFEAYWEIPASEDTAIRGRWVQGPGADFFERMEARLGPLPVVAEDLGLITEGVRELMKRFGYPGMAVLQFGFDSGPDSTFVPHNFKQELVVYTGTHDNDTLRGWWDRHTSTQSDDEAEAARAYARSYLELQSDDDFPWRSVRTLIASVARITVVPVQDVLGLGSEARMNTPGLAEGNWTWRLGKDLLTAEHAADLAQITELFGRTAETR
ncbi:MAG: 4-alpha-glucanotransferase [Bacteroidota bacterium]